MLGSEVWSPNRGLNVLVALGGCALVATIVGNMYEQCPISLAAARYHVPRITSISLLQLTTLIL